jgi:hypothetical protein
MPPVDAWHPVLGVVAIGAATAAGLSRVIEVLRGRVR